MSLKTCRSTFAVWGKRVDLDVSVLNTRAQCFDASLVCSLPHFIRICLFMCMHMGVCMCVCTCVCQQCAISAPCSKTKGNKAARERKRHCMRKDSTVGGRGVEVERDKRIVFIISSTQRNLITLLQQRGLTAREDPVCWGICDVQTRYTCWIFSLRLSQK